jgi:hypothetical protein
MEHHGGNTHYLYIGNLNEKDDAVTVNGRRRKDYKKMCSPITARKSNMRNNEA